MVTHVRYHIIRTLFYNFYPELCNPSMFGRWWVEISSPNEINQSKLS